MKTKKKEIRETLRSLNVTAIFRIAKLNNVDIDNRSELKKWIENNSPDQKTLNNSYDIAYIGCYGKTLPTNNYIPSTRIGEVIQFAKKQKSENWMATNYGKILIEGNTNIYWANPSYGHSDYNKSIALKKTEKNVQLMNIINNYLTK